MSRFLGGKASVFFIGGGGGGLNFIKKLFIYGIPMLNNEFQYPIVHYSGQIHFTLVMKMFICVLRTGLKVCGGGVGGWL